ncbi:hypothetical protein PGTUg99_022526 [Puccinia graminis f. sp. tritici]|uniref:Uncharacterized protein n=1 Tax=Puccinia graminis f. sp. tritici TaxID=56615 RepID=A0A5B0NKH8_PUCGR|nr:hypothetical protein PGTUg99_022526 [Puccinia graminis f. sp. tritici]
MVGQLSRSYWIVPLDISPLHDIAIHWSFHPKRGPADYVLFTFKTPSMFFYYHPLDASDNTCQYPAEDAGFSLGPIQQSVQERSAS